MFRSSAGSHSLSLSHFKLVLTVAVSVLLFMSTRTCLAGTQATDDEAMVRRFFELREQMLDQRGTAAQVDQLLSLFKTGGHYEHPAFSVVMTLDEAKSGMLSHLREGRDAKITVNKIFFGSNFIVTETTLRYSVVDDDGVLKKIERNGVAIFEMEAARIVRVAEY